jgi:hypothetical protein
LLTVLVVAVPPVVVDGVVCVGGRQDGGEVVFYVEFVRGGEVGEVDADDAAEFAEGGVEPPGREAAAVGVPEKAVAVDRFGGVEKFAMGGSRAGEWFVASFELASPAGWQGRPRPGFRLFARPQPARARKRSSRFRRREMSAACIDVRTSDAAEQSALDGRVATHASRAL